MVTTGYSFVLLSFCSSCSAPYVPRTQGGVRTLEVSPLMSIPFESDPFFQLGDKLFNYDLKTYTRPFHVLSDAGVWKFISFILPFFFSYIRRPRLTHQSHKMRVSVGIQVREN